MASSKRARDPYADQIAAETQLRYGPQFDALTTLLANARSQRNQALSVNESTAQALARAASLARPDVSQANADYLGQLLAAKQTLGSPDTAAYAASGDPYKQALARDMANAQTRAAETTKAASDELTQRGLDARAGAVAGARAINDKYASDSDQIAQQAQQLSGQAGTYGSSRLAELMADAQKQAHETAQARADRRTRTSIASADRTSREGIASADRTSRENIAADKNDPAKKVKWQSAAQAGKAADAIAAAREVVKKMKAAGRSRSEIGSLLVAGRPAGTVQNPKTGQLLPVAGVAKVPQLFASVALDMEFDGHISSHGGSTGHGNVGELHKRRYKISDLGLPTQPPKSTAPRATTVSGIGNTGGLPVGPIGAVSLG